MGAPRPGAIRSDPGASPVGGALSIPQDYPYRQAQEEPPWWAFWIPKPDPYQLNPVTPDQLENLRATAQQLGFTQDEFFQVLEASKTGDYNSVLDLINNVILPQRQYVEAQRQAGNLKTQQENTLNELTGTLRSELSNYVGGENTGKYPTGLRPNFLEQEPGYAKQLSEADAAINANIDRARLSASRGVADAGLRASGKATDQVRQVESSGAYLKGKTRADLTGEALGTARDLWSGIYKDIPEQRINYNQGNVDRLFGLSNPSSRDSFGQTTGLGFDTRSLNFGRSDADRAFALQALLGLIGAGQNAGEGLTNTISTFKGG